MYLTLRIDEVRDLVRGAVEAGVQSYLRYREPDKDRLSHQAALRYVRQCGFRPRDLDRWLEAGLITRVKSGESKTCTQWYSLAELKETVLTLKVQHLQIDTDKARLLGKNR